MYITTEKGAHSHERNTTEGLGQPDHASNLSTAKVDTAEAVPEVATGGHLHLELVGSLHHLHVCVKVKVHAAAGAGETLDGLSGLIVAALADQPPRGLGYEDGGDDDGAGPDPLQSKGFEGNKLVCAVGSVGR